MVGAGTGCAGVGFSALQAASNNKIKPALRIKNLFIFVINLQIIRSYSADQTHKCSPVVIVGWGMLFSAARGRNVHSGKIKSGAGWETLLDPCYDLKIRHFFSIFQADDISCQSFTLKVFLEFVLGLSRAQDLDLRGILNMLDDLVVVFAEMVPETPVAYFFRRAIPRDNG